jgi:hypothetical protein
MAEEADDQLSALPNNLLYSILRLDRLIPINDIDLLLRGDFVVARALPTLERLNLSLTCLAVMARWRSARSTASSSSSSP